MRPQCSRKGKVSWDIPRDVDEVVHRWFMIEVAVSVILFTMSETELISSARSRSCAGSITERQEEVSNKIVIVNLNGKVLRDIDDEPNYC